jgi:hypothetical protein
MNFQDMSHATSKAIEDFSTCHRGTLQLYIKDGQVCTRECKKPRLVVPTSFNVPVWYQTHGFTEVEWNSLITELLNLYNKEKACQNQQKP